MFEVGDYVVYGKNGVCEVKEITTMDLRGVSSDKKYYRLAPIENPTSRVFVPVDNEKIVMRSVLAKEEAQALIEKVSNLEPLEVPDDKFREEKYKEILNGLESEKWLQIIKTLHIRKQERIAMGKKNTSLDERYFKQLLALVCNEFSHVLGIGQEEVKGMLRERLSD